MSQQPISFSVPEASFDLALLPEGARTPGSESFQEAVTRYYKDAYREDVQSLTQLGMVKSDLGELEEARRLLERAVQLDSTNG